MPRILHLTLKKKWFDMIATGEKKEEYREWKNYWTSRLLKRGLADVPATWAGDTSRWKEYDIICFRHAYTKNAPEMEVEFKGIGLSNKGNRDWGWSKTCIGIKLGKILSIKNYNP